jgi:hypothetical protein
MASIGAPVSQSGVLVWMNWGESAGWPVYVPSSTTSTNGCESSRETVPSR